MTVHLNTNIISKIYNYKKYIELTSNPFYDDIKSTFRNSMKSTLAMERLKPATELKLVSHGNEFHAFTTCSLKKLDLAQVLLRLINNLKL